MLDGSGRAGVEVKTGNAKLERNQEPVYLGCIDGSNCVKSAGEKARQAYLLEGAVPETIYILRPKGE